MANFIYSAAFGVMAGTLLLAFIYIRRILGIHIPHLMGRANRLSDQANQLDTRVTRIEIKRTPPLREQQNDPWATATATKPEDRPDMGCHAIAIRPPGWDTGWRLEARNDGLWLVTPHITICITGGHFCWNTAATQGFRRLWEDLAGRKWEGS